MMNNIQEVLIVNGCLDEVWSRIEERKDKAQLGLKSKRRKLLYLGTKS